MVASATSPSVVAISATRKRTSCLASKASIARKLWIGASGACGAILDDAGIAALADEYERQRISEQRQVIRYGDGLVSMFSNELPLLGQMRAAGLGLLDLLPALKAQAALSGMGMTCGGNRLLRGHL